MNTSFIPAIYVDALTIPEAWEKTVLAVWEQGVDVKTQYDKPEDPPSKDATVMVTVRHPFMEPRIHKNFPGGPEELESYRQEVVNGIHDHWIDPDAGKWTYTYHQRLFDYLGVDQIQYIIDGLSKTGFTRRCQAITWQPENDPPTGDPPCLQRIWCRILRDANGTPFLNMNTHWRSRDLYKAWFMNVYALTDLQRHIAEKISDKTGEEIHIGRYVDINDSLHLYGSYFEDMKGEIEKMSEGGWENRAWSSDHPAFALMTNEAQRHLEKDPDCYAKGSS